MFIFKIIVFYFIITIFHEAHNKKIFDQVLK